MNSGISRSLILSKLEQGTPGINREWGKLLSQAGTICLEYNRHIPGVILKVTGTVATNLPIFWDLKISEQDLRSWEDNDELVEYGSCGIAVLLVLELTDFTVIRRARKGTKVDYWLGHKNALHPLQDAARLEVSGILSGGAREKSSRIRLKTEQVGLSKNSLPAYIVIIEFSEPSSYMVKT